MELTLSFFSSAAENILIHPADSPLNFSFDIATDSAELVELKENLKSENFLSVGIGTSKSFRHHDLIHVIIFTDKIETPPPPPSQ